MQGRPALLGESSSCVGARAHAHAQIIQVGNTFSRLSQCCFASSFINEELNIIASSLREHKNLYPYHTTSLHHHIVTFITHHHIITSSASSQHHQITSHYTTQDKRQVELNIVHFHSTHHKHNTNITHAYL